MVQNKIKVIFFLPTLHAGGAERVISFVSQNIDKSKFDILLVITGYERESKYNIDKIPVVFLNKKRVPNSGFAIINILIKKKPNIVLSSIGHLNSLLGLISILFPNIKFIGRQASVAKAAAKYNNSKKKLKPVNKLSDFGIIKLDCIICQSDDMKKDFLESYNINENKVKIIHNPITQISTNSINAKNSIKHFITIGRLSKIKGFFRILEILSKLEIPFKYTIIGEGFLKDAIFNKIVDLNLSDKIEYIPHTDNVLKYLIKSDVYLQGSFSEGFPNALLESCSVGIPVIAFNVPGGTKEIVQHNVNGYLINDFDNDSYLNYLKEDKIWDPITIKDSVYKKFNKEKIIKDYENLFLEILNDKK